MSSKREHKLFLQAFRIYFFGDIKYISRHLMFSDGSIYIHFRFQANRGRNWRKIMGHA